MDIQNFFGREETIQLIKKRIHDLKEGYRQNIAITGQELVGKTFLVQYLLATLNEDKIFLIYTSTEGSLRQFCQRFLGSVLGRLGGKQPQETHNMDDLLDSIKNQYPKIETSIKTILSDLEKNKTQDVFQQLLDLPSLIFTETGNYCVIIIDEFLRLKDYEISHLYQELSKRILIQKQTMYIILSAFSLQLKQVLTEKLSLLFGNFELINLGAFSPKESADLMDSRLGKDALPFTLKAFLVNFTQGLPFYLDFIIQELKSVRAEELIRGQGGSASIIKVLERLLFADWGTLNLQFQARLNQLYLIRGGGQQLLEVLLSLALSHQKVSEIAADLKKLKKDIKLRLNRLLEKDIISHSGCLYCINDPVFSFWLRYVYFQKMNALLPDEKYALSIFRGQIEKEIDATTKSLNVPLSERILELFQMFKDDSIQIERRLFRLAQFKELKTFSFEDGGIRIGIFARAKEALWIVGLKEKTVTENDVLQFKSECRKLRHRCPVRIIVSSEIDSNARLLAKEEKIATWETQHLNFLLRFYHQPLVVT